MSESIKFGQQAMERPNFQINEKTFTSLPLSLAEEQRLADTGTEADTSEKEVIQMLLTELVKICNHRAIGKSDHVTVDWLMENLTPLDLEGLLDYLRQSEQAK